MLLVLHLLNNLKKYRLCSPKCSGTPGGGEVHHMYYFAYNSGFNQIGWKKVTFVWKFSFSTPHIEHIHSVRTCAFVVLQLANLFLVPSTDWWAEVCNLTLANTAVLCFLITIGEVFMWNNLFEVKNKQNIWVYHTYTSEKWKKYVSTIWNGYSCDYCNLYTKCSYYIQKEL